MINKLGMEEEKVPEICSQLYKDYGMTMAGLAAIGYVFDYDDYHRENQAAEWLVVAGVARLFGFLFCLVSLSVMASNRNEGWAVDSFYKYKEFRYCISVNAIGFVHSAAQAFDFDLDTGQHIVLHQQPFRHYFDFALDQEIGSASTSST